MKRQHRTLALICGWCLLHSSAWSQWAVIDAGNIAQNVIQATNSVRQVAQQAQQLVNEATQIYNQVQQIQHLYTQVQHGIRNLQHFNLNYASEILGLAGQLDAKMAQAQMLGYQVTGVVSQMNGLYGRVSAVSTWEEGNLIRRRWVEASREAGNVAGQVTAIQRHLQDSSRRVAELTQRMNATQGNLDTLQALGQGQGLMNEQLLAMEQQLAIQGRLMAMEAQERAAREAAQLEWEGRWFPPASTSTYVGQGRVLQLAP